ncbi:MAG: ThiF family adenylyltransferase [Candidatus Thermoplasmatota archaeon]|nr:ThiF family adenylyltransferase [Candidatus Thermoplasmatota archaeon]
MEEQLRIGAVDDEPFDRARRIGWLDLDAVFRTKVLMVGAGALGNEVGKNLVLSGFRHVTVVDMDHVMGSNLNRCLFFSRVDVSRRSPKAEVVARGMNALSEHANVESISSTIEELDEGLYRVHDIILGCLDNIPTRLHVNSRSYRFGKTLIDGGMEGFVGRVFVANPPNGACIQCGMNKSHAKVANLRFSCTGKDVVFHEPRLPAEITTTSVISAIMVRECLKFVSGRTDMMLSNAFFYDGQRNVSEELEFDIDPLCPNH